MLDRLDQLRRVRALRWLTGFTRVLLAVGFIAPGLSKVVGHRFADPSVITTDTAMGYFFDAFYQTGAYYGFVGAAQVLAGVLLLVPRTALLGALLYLPIMGNIAVLTWATRFGNTAYVAALMTLAALYLVAWDARRLAPLFRAPADRLTWPRRPVRSVAAALAVAGGLATTLAMRGLVPGVAKAQLATVMLAGLAVVALAAVLALADRAWAWWRGAPTPSAEPPSAEPPSAAPAGEEATPFV